MDREEEMKKVLCDPVAVEEFNYDGLATEFQVLAKPAQRALVRNGDLTARALAKFREREIRAWHGMGPRAISQIKKILQGKGLKFKAER